MIGSISRRRYLARSLACAIALSPNVPMGQKLQRGRIDDHPEWAEENIKIGLLQPLSGPLSPLGQRAVAAARNAIAWVNLKGGIASLEGKLLFGVVIDIMAYPGGATEAVAAAQEAGVSAILGCSTTPLSREVAIAAADINLPLLVDGAIGDNLFSEETLTTFRLAPDYSTILDQFFTLIEELMIKEMSGAAADDPGDGAPVSSNTTPPDDTPLDGEEIVVNAAGDEVGSGELLNAKLAIVRGIGAFGEKLETDIIERLKESSLDIDPAMVFNPADTTAAEILGEIAKTKPDWLVVWAYADLFDDFLEVFAQSDWRPKAVISLLGGFTTNGSTLKAHGENLEGWIDISIWPDDKLEGTALFQRRFNAEKIPMTLDTIFAHDSIMLLKEAIEAAASVEREALLASLRASQFESATIPFGATAFENGQNLTSRAFTLQLKNGQLRHVASANELHYPLVVL